MVGGGLVGLTVALALADRGASVLVLTDERSGEASSAAAGVLAPSVNPKSGAAQLFAVAARDYYPAFVAAIRERTGVGVPLNRLGVLQLAPSGEDDTTAQSGQLAGASWLDAADLSRVEPELGHPGGAVLHPYDGAVNNLVLLAALKQVLAGHPRVRLVAASVEALEPTSAVPAVRTREGARYAAERLVLAAGAWVARLGGLPRPLPVAPVRGQAMSVAFGGLAHVVYGGGGYAVPRGDHTVIGATSEEAGYDTGPTPEGLAELRGFARAMSAQLGAAPLLATWAGLRPMTPDQLPILGQDPERPAVLYACGHSRNGILLAPLAAECVAAVALGETPPFAVDAFAVSRFANWEPGSRRSSEAGSGPPERRAY